MRQGKTRKEYPSEAAIEAELKRVRYGQRFRSILISSVSTLLTVAAVAVLGAMLWMPVLEIYGASMSPTLEPGQIVVAMDSRSFRQGDVVAFYYGNKLLVKRCIAGPGQWVNIDADGNVYVDGALLDEPYLQDKALGECDLELPYQVPEERWFLIGDQRTVSVDSRNTQVGCIAHEQIVGRVLFRVWPLSAFGAV